MHKKLITALKKKHASRELLVLKNSFTRQNVEHSENEIVRNAINKQNY